MNKIYSGKDRAAELHLKNYRDLISFLCKKNGTKWGGGFKADAAPATAFITGGRWAWACECGNSMYADPSDPIGFCDQCENVLTGEGFARPILFPENRKEIEMELLERSVSGNPILMEKFGKRFGNTQLSNMPQFQPVDLPRNWSGESVEQLKEAHRQKKADKEKKEHGENSIPIIP